MSGSFPRTTEESKHPPHGDGRKSNRSRLGQRRGKRYHCRTDEGRPGARRAALPLEPQRRRGHPREARRCDHRGPGVLRVAHRSRHGGGLCALPRRARRHRHRLHRRCGDNHGVGTSGGPPPRLRCRSASRRPPCRPLGEPHEGGSWPAGARRFHEEDGFESTTRGSRAHGNGRCHWTGACRRRHGIHRASAVGSPGPRSTRATPAGPRGRGPGWHRSGLRRLSRGGSPLARGPRREAPSCSLGRQRLPRS